MKEDKELKFSDMIYSKISKLSGPDFENLVQAILRDAGFQDVIKQSSGFQGGFDIRAKYQGLAWRFEAKKKEEALNENDLAVKFDQIERDPGDIEYYIIVTNTSISNELKKSVESHRNKWYIDLDYWSLCNDKFRKILLSYPNSVVRKLELTKKESDLFLSESRQYLALNKPFLEEEFEGLLRTSNRFNLLQNVSNSISATQEQNVRPKTDFSKLIPRRSANNDLESFKTSSEYSCFFLVAKEQMGKSSLLRLWSNSVRTNNIVLFFTARDICSKNWLKELQNKIYPEIEKLSGGRLQCPEYLSTVFNKMQLRLKSRDAFIYVFVDALNTASYSDVKDFFGSDNFNESLSSWRFNWIFSCREAMWKEWKENINIHNARFEFTLKEFNDEELELALKTHKIELANVPHWLMPKLKWPGLLRLYYSEMQSNRPDILRNMSEMALAEISLLFIRERMEEFSGLYPGGIPMSREGVEERVDEIVDLFNEQGYRTLPFNEIRLIKDFDPHDLAENSWNVLLQQGFLTKNQENYELGNDWAVILIGKHLIDTCTRNDVSESAIGSLLDKIFDGIAPLGNEQFEDILWFSLHYGRIRNISESLFSMILDRIFEEQNISHDYLSKVGARLFPQYSISYIANSVNVDRALYLREGLEKVSSENVIPHVIKLFPNVSNEIKLQLVILLEHYKDLRYLDEVYSLMDQNLLIEDKEKKIRIEDRLMKILGQYPDECCSLIQSRFEKGKINNLQFAISLIGFNGSAKHKDLLQRLIRQQPRLQADSLIAMGRLRMPEVEDVAMEILDGGEEADLQRAAIEALGHLQSERLFKWCKDQNNLWDRDCYMYVIHALQNFKSAEAYDLIISLELQQEKWISFISFYTQNRLRQLNKNQFIRMVDGILNKIQDGKNLDAIWRGLHNLSTLNSKSFKSWWQEYQGTKVPQIIADLAKLCAKPEYFDSLSQTIASSTMDEALKILDWIGDKKIFVSILLDLMKREIPRLFAWILVPFIMKYADQSFKEILVKIVRSHDNSERKRDNGHDLVIQKAIQCLTYLEGNDVFDIILKYRNNRYSENENNLKHFENGYTIRKVVEVFQTKNEALFWSAYCFLWDFLVEQAIEPCLNWIKDPNCQPWIRNYLARLIGRFDKPDYNSQLIEFLNDPSIRNAAIEILIYSKDEQIHAWFKRKIVELSKSPVTIFNDIDKKDHEYIIKWIDLHSYRECKPYLQRWLETKEITWLTAQWLFYSIYDVIAKFEFWDLLESVKNKYYHWNPHWGSHIFESTLKLLFKREPDWAWNEFLKYWNNSSDFQRKNAIKWMIFMPSKTAIEWMINAYPNIGSFFSDEKEIRQSIRKIIINFPEEVRQYGIELLKEKALSNHTKDRIDAAVCSGLFGEEIYKQFYFLLDDPNVRVRELYSYADISETELMSAQ